MYVANVDNNVKPVTPDPATTGSAFAATPHPNTLMLLLLVLTVLPLQLPQFYLYTFYYFPYSCWNIGGSTLTANNTATAMEMLFLLLILLDFGCVIINIYVASVTRTGASAVAAATNVIVLDLYCLLCNLYMLKVQYHQ